MKYQIAEFHGPHGYAKPIAEVATIEAAREYLAANFEIVAFEEDEANNAADAMVTPKGQRSLIQYSINPIN